MRRLLSSVALALPLSGLLLSGASAFAQVVPTNEHAQAITAAVTPRMADRAATIGHDLGDPVFLRIIKETSRLEVWMGGDDDGTPWDLLGAWPICAWAGTLGPKLAEGDMQSPEGFYFLVPGRMNPNSQWHLGMNIGYPNAYDRFHGRTGHSIVIHGVCGSSGCFAMTDPLIEELWVLVEAAMNAGQSVVRVHIFPFEMTDAALQAHATNEWYPFWQNLQEGWNWFETHGEPPNVEVVDGRYVFGDPD